MKHPISTSPAKETLYQRRRARQEFALDVASSLAEVADQAAKNLLDKNKREEAHRFVTEIYGILREMACPVR
jgi:uncharacterized protein with GYD domain